VKGFSLILHIDVSYLIICLVFSESWFDIQTDSHLQAKEMRDAYHARMKKYNIMHPLHNQKVKEEITRARDTRAAWHDVRLNMVHDDHKDDYDLHGKRKPVVGMSAALPLLDDNGNIK